MLVSVPLSAGQLSSISSLAALHECYADAYAGQKLVRVLPLSTQSDMAASFPPMRARAGMGLTSSSPETTSG